MDRPVPLTVSFVAATTGTWNVDRVTGVIGEGLPFASRVSMQDGAAPMQDIPDRSWVLRGTVSNARYTNRSELTSLTAIQQGLGRPEATFAALIPIRKSPAWWALAQNERRRLIEEKSRHISIGLEYLPAIARRLHHSRDLGEPFDFLTWFEFSPEHAGDLEDLVLRLRETEEWTYVDREVDIRLSR